MSASNKLIFSLAQNLDIDEKNQARKNIGAVGCGVLAVFATAEKATDIIVGTEYAGSYVANRTFTW